MAIQLASNCMNCAAFGEGGMCNVHQVTVGVNYTCGQFTFNADLNREAECSNCARFQGNDCPHPKTATRGMSCSSWAPQSKWLVTEQEVTYANGASDQ